MRYFIETHKGTVSENIIDIYFKDHKQISTEMGNAYRCLRILIITDALIEKTKDHIFKTMLLWRKLKMPVTPSAHWFEDYIVYQMENIVGGLADKSEDHIKRAYQDGKRSEKKIVELQMFNNHKFLNWNVMIWLLNVL